jgi:hypothetical protein
MTWRDKKRERERERCMPTACTEGVGSEGGGEEES